MEGLSTSKLMTMNGAWSSLTSYFPIGQRRRGKLLWSSFVNLRVRWNQLTAAVGVREVPCHAFWQRWVRENRCKEKGVGSNNEDADEESVVV